jgi:YihY family inner membrane protein
MVAHRLDGLQRRHGWLAVPIAVLYKFVEDQGYYLAALLAYYGFLSLFPLLLLLVTGLGFALENDPGLQQQVLHSALIDFPVIGQQIEGNIHSLHGSVTGVVIGGVGAVLGGLSVAGAGQAVMNRVWAVPRVRRPGIGGYYLRGLLLVATFVVGVVLTTGLTALTTAVSGFAGDGLAVLVRVAASLLAAGVNVLLFLLGFRVLTAREVTLRQLRPGAVTAAVTWQVVLEAGTWLVGHELRGTSATYGLFGIVLGLLTWLYLGGFVIVIGAEINAVRTLGLWPRSLLALFTGSAELTDADRDAYTAYAGTEQRDEREDIDVRFPRETPPAQREQPPPVNR